MRAGSDEGKLPDRDHSFLLSLNRLNRLGSDRTWQPILTSNGIVVEYSLLPWSGASVRASTALRLTAHHAATNASIAALIELHDDTFSASVSIESIEHVSTEPIELAKEIGASVSNHTPCNSCRPDAIGNTKLHNLELQVPVDTW